MAGRALVKSRNLLSSLRIASRQTMTIAKFFKPMSASGSAQKRERPDESSPTRRAYDVAEAPEASGNDTRRCKSIISVCGDDVGAQACGPQSAVCTLRALIVEDSWSELASAEAKKPYWTKLESFMRSEWATKTVYPRQEHIFRSLNSVPLTAVRVVIIGQDPYHGVGQAEGWSFSVPKGQKIPSSLQNIYKEIQSDVGCSIPRHGHLEAWVKQGVLLLNTSLTVEAHKANSHSKKGWEIFTETVISYLSKKQHGLVFLLWGKHAQARKKAVHPNQHTILECAHPSGLSAHRGFFGCRHFSQANAALKAKGLPEVDWQIPN